MSGAIVGPTCVIVLWIYGLMMPAMATWDFVRQGRSRQIAAYLMAHGLSRLGYHHPLMCELRRLYRLAFDGYFVDHAWLTPNHTINEGTKRLCTLAGPHGIFSLALMRTMQPQGYNSVLCVDDFLATWNPFMRIAAKCAGMQDLCGLRHDKIQSLMQDYAHDVVVIAGGFVEASVGTATSNRIVTHMWPYWVKMSLMHKFDVGFLWVYGGTEVFAQSDVGLGARLSLARRGIPAVIPSGKWGMPIPLAPKMRVVSARLELPHLPEPSPTDVSFWVDRFHAKVETLIHRTPPPPSSAPVELCNPLRAHL